MKESKHTPLPWQLDGRFVVDQNKQLVSTVIEGDKQPWRANAEFIVRAVNCHDEMLKTLQDAEQLIDGPIGDLLTGDSMADSGAYDVLNLIRAAIAKATERS